MKRLVLIPIIAMLCCPYFFAQELQIHGRILSPSNTPIEYATIVLQTPDSTFITGGVTDQRGRFTMDNLKKGSYNLQISSLGYETKNMAFPDFDKNMDMGNIVVDSATISLEEITVTASNVINQSDRKIVLPTAHQIKASNNGLSLLQQLQLNRIYVNIMKKEISASGGGEVQLRINGAKSNIEEISSLRPEDILRIEYHDDPGLRYDGAAAVIDYITRRRDRGGYVSLDTQNSPHITFGNNQLNAKLNYKKSEFSTYYYGGYRSFNGMWRENTETFNFEDRNSLVRKENGTPDKWALNWHSVGINYNYQEPEKYFFNATIRGWFNGQPKKYYQSKLYPVDNPEEGVDMIDRSSEKENSPSIDLYYQHSLKNKQTLVINVVGTYIDSHSERTYSESKNEELLTDIFSNIDGNKYSIIGEGIYEKAFSKSKLSTGLKHNQSFSDNKYTGSTNAKTKMTQSDTYAYVEYQGKIKKFNYLVGVGASRSWFEQSGDGYQHYTFRPTLRLTYNFNDNSFIRYRGSMSSSSPSLGDLGETEQLIDSLQIRRGNPNLKPYRTFSNSLNYDFHKGIFNLNFYLGYWYYDKPIMEQTLREGNKFIRTNFNQKSWQKLNPELGIKVGPIKDLITLSLTTGINYFDSRGNNYHHTYTNWYYRAEVMLYYKKWMAMFQIQNHHNNFYGESLNYGENFHGLFVMYKHKQLSCGVIVLNPFINNWRSGGENWSVYAPSKNWHYLKESSQVFAISFAYSFSFGRKYESASKRLSNQDTDSGVLSGGK